MQKSLGEIAEFIGGELVGDASILITGISGIKEAKKGDITFLANPKYIPLMEITNASALITPIDTAPGPKPIIRVNNPSLSFAMAASLFLPLESVHPKGIHPTAQIAKGVILGKDIAVGPYAVIEGGVSIGDRSIIYAGCFIGDSVTIGSDCLIYANVSIRERVVIGERVIIHSGSVIGSDGFGFTTVNGIHHKIPQIGIVEIGDDVEIGANATIDRARFDKTIIGRGTKIDNLVHLAHNVITGENCLIVAQTGVSGSTTLGNNVTLAGQAGLVGHITIGDNAIVAAQGGVTKSVPANTMVSGYPARAHDKAIRVNACVQNLPKLYDTVNELKKKIVELEEKLKNK